LTPTDRPLLPAEDGPLQGRDLDADPRTFEAYYDPALDVTWLADADLAAREVFGVAGIDANGGMDWATANAWIAALNAAGHLGRSDWRLPRALPQDGVAHDLESRNDGGSDVGYNVAAPGTAFAESTASELAHLHFVTLANRAAVDLAGVATGCTALPRFCVANPGPFALGDLGTPGGGVFWTSTALAGDPIHDGDVLGFDVATGFQGISEASVANLRAWPVRSGDTLPVPEPTAGAAAAAAAIALAGRRGSLRNARKRALDCPDNGPLVRRSRPHRSSA
jgi:hypothetical protein